MGVGPAGIDERVDLYIRALASFGEQVAAIPGDEWDLHTPCSEWDVRTVVTHVVLGEAQLADLIEGHEPSTTELDVGILGSNPMAVWRGTALRAIEAVQRTPLDTPLGRASGALLLSQLLGFRITENAVHAWDLATARSADFRIPDDVAEWLLDFWLPLTDVLADSEYWGPMTAPRDDTAGARLLALLGR